MSGAEDLKTSMRLWEQSHHAHGVLERRASGELPQMEATVYLSGEVGRRYRPGETLLDAGCGAGHFLRGFAGFLPPSCYTGVDVSPALVEAGRRHFPQATFEVAAIEQLPAKGRRYDHVVCSNVIPHVDSLWDTLEALVAVTARHLYIRALVGEQTYLIRHVHSRASFPGISGVDPGAEIDARNEPADYHNFNIYSRELVLGMLTRLGVAKVDIFPDTFMDLARIAGEAKRSANASRVVDGQVAIGNVICPWAYLFVER